MRLPQRRIGLIAGAVGIAVLVTGFLVRKGLDRADKWASVAGGCVAVAGLLAAVLRRPATGSGGSPTFTGAPLAAPADTGTALIRGRNRELRRLQRAARRPDGAVHVLTGLGGVGKSFLAVSLCRWFEEHGGRAAWWIAAQDQASLIDGLVSLAEAHSMDEVQVTAIRNGAPRAVERLWELLRQTPQRWLLVFDNLDDPRLVAELIRSGVARCGDRGLVLATSRTSRRLLVNWRYDRSPARLGRGDRWDRSFGGCPQRFGVALIWRASCRSPWRGEAPEGSAQLKVALSSSPIAPRIDRAGGPEWDASSSAWTRTSGPRPSRSSTAGRGS